jgi:phosphate-selective porin OprO/OprP
MKGKKSVNRSLNVFAAAILMTLSAIGAVAQTPDGTPSTPTAEPTPAVSPSPSPSPKTVASPTPEIKKSDAQPAAVNYFFPDAPPTATTINNKYFSFRVGFGIFADYTLVGQNAASRSQVGPQASVFDLRSARIMLSGSIKFKRPWTYLFAYDFNELRLPQDQIFDPYDVNLTIPLWREARITIGRQKEPFVYEMVGDAASAPSQERILSPFFTSRNIGFRYSDNYRNDRIALSIGVFNDWFTNHVPLNKSGTQVSGRLSGLPFSSKDGSEYLHIGIGLRYNGADDGKLRFKGRPESNVIDNYVDTGSFAAKYAAEISLEALYNRGPFSLTSEFVHARVESPSKGNPGFSGFYVTGSYVLTGENRPYDRKVGYARRIMPKSRWGAIELVGRFSYLDMDADMVKGGKLAKWYTGVNWWASRQWKLGLGYGLSDLDRFNKTGRTQALQYRLQWTY